MEDAGAFLSGQLVHEFKVTDGNTQVKHIGQFNRCVNAILTSYAENATQIRRRTMSVELSPGQLVQAAMDRKGWSQSDVAFALGTTKAAINQIVSDKRAISHNMARSLGAALDISAEELATAQALWEVKRADEPDSNINARARILSRYPLRDMIKRGWIDPDDTTKPLEQQICNFFSVSSLDDVPHLSHSAKKTSYDSIPPSQLAWLFRVRQIASEMVVDPYQPSALDGLLDELAEMKLDPTMVRRVPRVLSQAGIRFVVSECLPGSKIDGVCFWLDERSPVIGMSLRFDRIDNFWFVLMHEIAHVRNNHGKINPIVDIELQSPDLNVISLEETLANEEAANFCVPTNKMENFFLRKKPFFPEREVIAFSKIVRTHPGLVVGQLQRRMDRYDILRQHLVKVKDHLASSMMFDGWGDIIPTER